MPKENTYAVLDCPQFVYSGQDYTFENGDIITHDLYLAVIKIKTGSAAQLIDRQDESLEKGFPLQLEFYSPHGEVIKAPIFRLGQVLPGVLCEKIEVFITLTQDQLWTLDRSAVDLPVFGY